jgi:hypothetical protein
MIKKIVMAEVKEYNEAKEIAINVLGSINAMALDSASKIYDAVLKSKGKYEEFKKHSLDVKREVCKLLYVTQQPKIVMDSDNNLTTPVKLGINAFGKVI